MELFPFQLSSQKEEKELGCEEKTVNGPTFPHAAFHSVVNGAKEMHLSWKMWKGTPTRELQTFLYLPGSGSDPAGQEEKENTARHWSREEYYSAWRCGLDRGGGIGWVKLLLPNRLMDSVFLQLLIVFSLYFLSSSLSNPSQRRQRTGVDFYQQVCAILTN